MLIKKEEKNINQFLGFTLKNENILNQKKTNNHFLYRL